MTDENELTQPTAATNGKTGTAESEHDQKILSPAEVVPPDETRSNTMDVHRHSGSHSGKKFKDYLFEFFMLFLAVSAGFWVENLREHYVERHREQQYIASLIRDLAADTMSMKNIIESTNLKIRGIDTLMRVLENQGDDYFVRDVYYYSFRYMFSAEFFSHTDGTITQLKNAGGLRLIQHVVSDSIIEYYSLADNVKWNSDFGLEQFKKIMDHEKILFDFKTLRKNKFAQITIRRGQGDIAFQTRDPAVLSRFYTDTFFFLATLENCNRMLGNLKLRARNLILFLKESYDIEG